MTLNFYVSYLVPVKPEKIQKIEQEIARIELTLSNALALDPSADRKEADLELTRLRAQMEPELRRESCNMRSEATVTLGPVRSGGPIVNWECPRCNSVVAGMRKGEIDAHQLCPGCGAEVHKEELPMSLDLYRMRTRRTDGVEVQAKQS